MVWNVEWKKINKFVQKCCDKYLGTYSFSADKVTTSSLVLDFCVTCKGIEIG